MSFREIEIKGKDGATGAGGSSVLTKVQKNTVGVTLILERRALSSTTFSIKISFPLYGCLPQECVMRQIQRLCILTFCLLIKNASELLKSDFRFC